MRLSQDFELQLRSLVGSGEPGALQAGRVSIIGLDRVKQRFGAAWIRLSERADRITRNTIERYLLPGDIFTAFGETNYAIVFSSLDTGRARMKCLMIADEVMKALLGAEGAELISVGTAVAQLDGSFSFDKMMSSDRPLDAAAPSVAPARADELHLERVATEELPRPTAVGPQFCYRPMWDTTNAVLSTYLATLVEPGNINAQADVDSARALDQALQEHALNELARLSKEGCKVLIGLSVHFETLAAAAHRRHYVQALEQGLSSIAAKLLVIEIRDMPEGVPQSRLYEIVSTAAALPRAGRSNAYRLYGLQRVPRYRRCRRRVRHRRPSRFRAHHHSTDEPIQPGRRKSAAGNLCPWLALGEFGRSRGGRWIPLHRGRSRR